MAPSIKTVSKILSQKNLPESIVYKIIRLFYHDEHQRKFQQSFEGIIDKAFKSVSGLCHADLETAVMWFYQCNCCERHSYNKAVIRDDDLMIVTKPSVFKAWRYDTEGHYHQCDCHCRQKGRMLAREFLKKKNPTKPYLMMQPVNETHRPASLGIREADYGLADENNNGGPDPDDPEYYNYMVLHFPHLVNH